MVADVIDALHTDDAAEAGSEGSVQPDPAAFLPFKSYGDAAEALRSTGYSEAHTCPSFTAEQLVVHTTRLVHGSGMQVMDMTSCIPSTTQAAYQALTVAGLTAASSCRKQPHSAFVIMRTHENTPSFLFGDHWGAVQSFGPDEATRRVKIGGTPTILVFHGETQLSVPASICAGTVELVARIIAQHITGDDAHFRCEVCKTPLSATVCALRSPTALPNKSLAAHSAVRARRTPPARCKYKRLQRRRAAASSRRAASCMPATSSRARSASTAQSRPA